LVVATGLSYSIAPAGAAKPPPPPIIHTVSVSVDTSCLATVTYTWSGFRGRSLVAEYELVDHTGGAFDFGIAFAYDPGVAGASGTGTKFFQLTVNGTSQVSRFAAIGRLGKFDHSGQFAETVPDAKATTLGPFNPSGCGFPIS